MERVEFTRNESEENVGPSDEAADLQELDLICAQISRAQMVTA